MHLQISLFHQQMQAGYSQGQVPGYSQGQATAGYNQAQVAGYSQAQVPAGYSPMQAGYRAIPAPPALDVSMSGGYGALMGGQYVPQSPMVSPAGQLMSPGGGMPPQGVTGSPMLMPGAPSAAAVPVSQQFSPMAAGKNSTSSNGSNGGVWQQQPQPPQGRPGPGAIMLMGAGMQLPEAMMQQFSQLGVSGGYESCLPGQQYRCHASYAHACCTVRTATTTAAAAAAADGLHATRH